MIVPKARKINDTTWFIQLRLNGVSIPITGETEAECTNKAILIKAKHKTGEKKVQKKKKDLTLSEVIDNYIDKYENVLSPSTICGYATIRRNRFPDYMDKSVLKIKDWQRMINKELETKSEHTVKNAWGLISAALKDSGYDVPSVKLAEVPIKEMPFLDTDEIKKFLKAAKGDDCELEMLLELHGLRKSEVMAVIKNNQFDLKHNTIIVSGAIVPDRNFKRVEKATNKNKTSTRTIPIMIPRLKVLLKEYEKQKKTPTLHSSSTMSRHVHNVCKAAGITDTSNHGLRHTFASLCYSQGLSERATMELGGWSNPDTMHRIYIRLSQRDKKKAQNAVADFFKNIK